MKKSLAKLIFTPVDNLPLRIPTGPKWWATTIGCSPNDWSVHVEYVDELTPENTILAELEFPADGSDYLIKNNSKFQLFGGLTQFKCDVEIIKP